VTVTAIPNSGYKFDYSVLDGTVRTDNPITITMNSDHILTVNFRKLGGGGGGGTPPEPESIEPKD